MSGLDFTTIGFVWIFVSVSLMFFPLRYMVSWMLFSCVFQAAAVFNMMGRGFVPLFLAEAVFIVKFLFTKNKKLKFPPKAVWIAVFMLYGCLATILLPVMFDGKIIEGVIYKNYVYPGINQYYTVIALDFTNLVRVFALFLNGTALLCLSAVEGLFTKRQLENVIKVTVIFVAVIGFWEYSYKRGFFPVAFPADFFYSNEGYTQLYLQGVAGGGGRLNSTFLEASYAGAFISSCLAGYFGAPGKKAYVPILFLLAAFGLNLSGTSFVAIVFSMSVMFMTSSNIKRGVQVLIAVFLIVFALFYLGTLDKYISMVTDKMDSVSGIVRTAGMLYGVKAFFSTYGLGSGLGTIRSFSLVTEVLAALGIIGFFLFFKMYYDIVFPAFKSRNDSSLYGFSFYFMAAFFASQVMAVPDLNFPVLWFGLFISVLSLSLRDTVQLQENPVRGTSAENRAKSVYIRQY